MRCRTFNHLGAVCTHPLPWTPTRGLSLPSTRGPGGTVPAVVGCGDVPFSFLRNNVLLFPPRVFTAVPRLALAAAVGALSSCGAQAALCECGLWAPRLQRPRRSFRRRGLWAPEGTACRSCCTRAPVPSWPRLFPDQRWSPCPRIGRQTLVHCSTREVPFLPFVFWLQTRIERSPSMESAGS